MERFPMPVRATSLRYLSILGNVRSLPERWAFGKAGGRFAALSMLERTISIANRGIDQGLHLGAQIFVSLNHKPILDDAVGEARPGVPMRRDSITHWWSSVKPVTAAAICQLWEGGKLDIEDRVAKYIPEFAAGGKEPITIRHLLTHTGGFRGTWRN